MITSGLPSHFHPQAVGRQNWELHNKPALSVSRTRLRETTTPRSIPARVIDARTCRVPTSSRMAPTRPYVRNLAGAILASVQAHLHCLIIYLRHAHHCLIIYLRQAHLHCLIMSSTGSSLSDHLSTTDSSLSDHLHNRLIFIVWSSPYDRLIFIVWSFTYVRLIIVWSSMPTTGSSALRTQKIHPTVFFSKVVNIIWGEV